jgi:hypothetical protein
MTNEVTAKQVRIFKWAVLILWAAPFVMFALSRMWEWNRPDITGMTLKERIELDRAGDATKWRDAKQAAAAAVVSSPDYDPEKQ